MSDKTPEKCPACGADQNEDVWAWNCESGIVPLTGKFVQSNKCKIICLTRLADELAEAVSPLLALVSILHSDCDHPSVPHADEYQAYKDAAAKLAAYKAAMKGTK